METATEWGRRELGRTKSRSGLPMSWNSMNTPIKWQRNFKNLPLTLLCGFVTILVLRGTLGFNTFLDSPARQEDESAAFEDDDEWNNEHVRNLAEVNLEFMEPERDPSEPYSLGPEIKNWNEERAQWLENNPHKKIAEGARARVLLVTGSPPNPCDNPLGDHFLLKSIKNKIDYCRLHDIEIFYNTALIDEEMSGFWAKLPLIRKLMLAHPDVEWIWWMDSDAMFTDMLFELPLDNYRDYNMVLHGWEEMVYEMHNWVGLNTGIFLLRNNQWALDLLDIWVPFGPKGQVRTKAGTLLTAKLQDRPPFEADDQSALIYLLGTREKELRPHVFLETEYNLHGYWVEIVEKYEEMMEKYCPGSGDERWPFVTHFVGCKPCDTINDYEAGRCVKHMERAFNFADNQILGQYGLRHRTLSTPTVKRISNASCTPMDVLGETSWNPEEELSLHP